MKQDIKTLWKNLANAKKNTARHHIQYCVLRAIASKAEDKLAVTKHFLRKSFSPVSNSFKLANGTTPFQVISNNKWALRVVNKIWNAETRDWDNKYTDILGVPADELLDEEELKLYIDILSKISSTGLIRNYSYFFTRQDIFEEYQLVQTAHAALELGAKLSPDQVKDLHFTCCGVPDLEALEDVERVLESMKVPYVVFREPDIGNQKTSIGVFPLEEHRRGILRSYPLLRFNRPTVESETA